MGTISVEVIVAASQEKVWNCWTHPEHIVQWNFASESWECPSAENTVAVGARFRAIMAAKDGSASFEFGGVYLKIIPFKLIEYELDDKRMVTIEFRAVPEGIMIVETFETEQESSEELQRTGWQAILNNFKKHVEEE